MLDEYLTAVGDLQRRMARAESFGAARAPAGSAPPGMFGTFEEQIGLVLDVLALAFQTDSTRIATFIVAHDGSNRPYPRVGIRDGHHDLSHHRDDDAEKAKLARINATTSACSRASSTG